VALSGMTGFARVEGAHGAWSWAVEARSVNGRNLETRFRGPPGFDSLDRAARDGAQSRFQRGQLTVNVQGKRAEAVGQTQVSVETLERYLKAGGPYVATGMVTKPSLETIASQSVMKLATTTRPGPAIRNQGQRWRYQGLGCLQYPYAHGRRCSRHHDC